MFKNKKGLALSKSKGFTLIELLVVIAIIGILASIVLASLNTARKKSRDARRIADIKQIQLALELYFDSQRDYPAALGDLDPVYISVVSNDPFGNAYTYEDCTVAGVMMYHLGANLEDPSNLALTTDLDGQPAACNGVWGSDLPNCTGAAGNCLTAFACCYDVSP